MKPFYLSSAMQQSLLMVSLFLTLILSLFLLIIVFGNHRDNRKRYLIVSVSLILFALLVILIDTFKQLNRGLAPAILLPVPMLLLWCIVGGTDLLFLWEMVGLFRKKGQTLNRN